MASSLVNRIAQGQRAPEFFLHFVPLLAQDPDPDCWLPAALTQIGRLVGTSHVALIQGVKGQWRTRSHLGSPPAVRDSWWADVLDTEQCLTNGSAVAAPVESPVREGWLLHAECGSPATAQSCQTEFAALAAAVGLALRASEAPLQWQNRAERLEALLTATVEWNRTRDTAQLLQEICQASTRLLEAERATVFLLDPVRRLLIGKPALGVASGEISIPADAGVVGRVVRTGEPQRVDPDVASEQAWVHREVDEQLQFQTRSLLCVPMRNTAGAVIGAFEVLNKRHGPFDDDDEAALLELAAHAAVAWENRQHVEQLVASQKQVADQAQNQVDFIGRSPGIQQVKRTIERVADTDLAILITGENGTGKEVAAQMLHYLSSRRDQVLVAVNCAALTESLLESELFGHEKGAFTDAHQTRIGKFELARHGTLFLDEIGDMSLSGQAKLLRVLEEKVVVRVGGSTPIPTQARVLAATNQNLGQLVREKRFREDLFFRLNVVSLPLPALRERGEDILLLAEHFLKIFAVKVRRKTPELTPAARQRLLAHDWPGNIRELRNMMERIAYLTTEPRIDARDLPFLDVPRPESAETGISLELSLSEATDQFQTEFIERQIQVVQGNMTEAARRLGLHRSNLYRKMKQLGMDPGGEGSP